MKKWKEWKKIGAALMAAVMVMGMATGCGSDGEAKNSEEYEGMATCADTVKISFSTWIGYAPWYIADKMGIFEEHGVDVQLSVIESAGDTKAAAAAGKIDGYCQTIDTIVMGSGAGVDSTMVLGLDTSAGGDGVVANKKFSTLADLKGAKIALDTSGGASLFYFNYLISQIGLTMDDFDIQNMSAGDAGSAFVGGSVDAAVTWEPWLTNAEQTDFGKVLCSSDEAPGVICDALAFNADFIEKYPGTVQAIIDSWYEALDMLEQDDKKEECLEIMGEYLGITAEEVVDTLEGVGYYDKEANIDYTVGGEMQSMAENAAQTWFDLGLMDEKADCSNIVDSSFIEGK